MSSKNDTGIMVFEPSYEEFKDFNHFVNNAEFQGAHRAGITKVKPPPQWIPRNKGYNTDDVMNLMISNPIVQSISGKDGIYIQSSEIADPMTVKEYKTLSESNEFKPPINNYCNIEKKYWDNITEKSPIYGADVSSSFIDEDVDVWNINKLGSILDYTIEDYGEHIQGIHTSYLYFGTWKTTFPWHIEDMDLYSINYIHYGEPKTWYSIPPEYGHEFEKLTQKLFPEEAAECPGFLRHKKIILSPEVLKENGIPVNKIIHNAGEIIITFPFGYHSGFNHGFNIAESTNFATPRWVEYGKRAKKCTCLKNSVVISMDTFVQRIQPEKYKSWLEGTDFGTHPEDPSYVYPSPKPCRQDVLINRNNAGIPKLRKIYKSKSQYKHTRSICQKWGIPPSLHPLPNYTSENTNDDHMSVLVNVNRRHVNFLSADINNQEFCMPEDIQKNTDENNKTTLSYDNLINNDSGNVEILPTDINYHKLFNKESSSLEEVQEHIDENNKPSLSFDNLINNDSGNVEILPTDINDHILFNKESSSPEEVQEHIDENNKPSLSYDNLINNDSGKVEILTNDMLNSHIQVTDMSMGVQAYINEVNTTSLILNELTKNNSGHVERLPKDVNRMAMYLSNKRKLEHILSENRKHLKTNDNSESSESNPFMMKYNNIWMLVYLAMCNNLSTNNLTQQNNTTTSIDTMLSEKETQALTNLNDQFIFNLNLLESDPSTISFIQQLFIDELEHKSQIQSPPNTNGVTFLKTITLNKLRMYLRLLYYRAATVLI